MNIPFTKHTLSNGLDVLLHEEHGDSPLHCHVLDALEQPVEEAPDAPEEIMEAAVEEIGPEGDREPD